MGPQGELLRACDACYTSHVTKQEGATLRRARLLQAAALAAKGSLVAASERLVRVFFLNGESRAIYYDKR